MRRAGTSIKGHFTDTNDQIIDPYIQPRAEVIAALGLLARKGASTESRANAARAIGILRGKAAVTDLIQALHSKDTQVIYEALVALQKIRDQEAASSIAFLLRDLDPKVQIAALETTGLLQNKSAVPDLVGVLNDARDNKVRRAGLTTRDRHAAADSAAARSMPAICRTRTRSCAPRPPRVTRACAIPRICPCSQRHMRMKARLLRGFLWPSRR